MKLNTAQKKVLKNVKKYLITEAKEFNKRKVVAKLRKCPLDFDKLCDIATENLEYSGNEFACLIWEWVE